MRVSRLQLFPQQHGGSLVSCLFSLPALGKSAGTARLGDLYSFVKSGWDQPEGWKSP